MTSCVCMEVEISRLLTKILEEMIQGLIIKRNLVQNLETLWKYIPPSTLRRYDWLNSIFPPHMLSIWHFFLLNSTTPSPLYLFVSLLSSCTLSFPCLPTRHHQSCLHDWWLSTAHIRTYPQSLQREDIKVEVSVQSIHSDERDEKKVLFIFKGRQKCKSIRFQRNTTAQSQLAALL